jgi:hypothetical protein
MTDSLTNDIIPAISVECDLGSEDQHPLPEVQNFYRLLAISDEKVSDDINLTILQVMTRLMVMKLEYNFSNQCYNDIMKLIIDLIPIKVQYTERIVLVQEDCYWSWYELREN